MLLSVEKYFLGYFPQDITQEEKKKLRVHMVSDLW